MKLYSYDKGDSSVVIKHTLAIDPGLKTSGFSLISWEQGSVISWEAPAEARKVLGLPFPDVFQRVSERVDIYLDQIPEGLDLSSFEVVVEYTYFGGEFSSGIHMLVSTLMRALDREVVVGRVTLVPAKIAQYFMRVRSATDSMVKKYVREKFPKEWFAGGKVGPHAADAMLFQAYNNYEWFVERGIELRAPKIERTVERQS